MFSKKIIFHVVKQSISMFSKKCFPCFKQKYFHVFKPKYLHVIQEKYFLVFKTKYFPCLASSRAGAVEQQGNISHNLVKNLPSTNFHCSPQISKITFIVFLKFQRAMCTVSVWLLSRMPFRWVIFWKLLTFHMIIKVFVQINLIGSNCELYLSKLQTVFVQIPKCICPNWRRTRLTYSKLVAVHLTGGQTIEPFFLPYHFTWRQTNTYFIPQFCQTLFSHV